MEFVVSNPDKKRHFFWNLGVLFGGGESVAIFSIIFFGAFRIIHTYSIWEFYGMFEIINSNTSKMLLQFQQNPDIRS